MVDNGEYEQQRRSARTPSPHWILEEDDEETSDEEDLLFTYSTDREGGSFSRILSQPSQQLIDLESSDEESLRLIVDTTRSDDENSQYDDDENSQHQQPPPAQQMLMIPSLADSEHSSTTLEEIYETQRKSKSPRRKSAASSPHALANKFNFQPATLSPVKMRRVASTPTPTKFQSFKPPKSPSPPSSGSPMRRSRASSIKTTISNAYSLRRQSSLPARETLWDNNHRDDDMSESSLDDDMAQLAQELAIPKSNRNIFRSVTVRSPKGRPPSPSSFRVATPPSVPTTPKNNMQDDSCKTDSNHNDPDSIRRVDTAITDGSDDEELGSLVGSARSSPQRRAAPTPLQAVGEGVDVTDVESDSSRDHLWQRRKVQYVIYLSTFACFGTIIRVFIGRFFGLDCEFQNNVNDWMSPISRHVCVTASGMTEQRGGALFVDLPGNMLGSFIMGLLTVLKPNTWPAIPWLKSDHPLQKHEILHIAIKTGLCGSLTTFASWNAQMVVMLDGSRTVLGPQIVEALYGYVLGIMTAIASFSFGTHVSAWLNNWRRNPVGGADNPSPPPIIVFPKIGGTKCGQVFKSLFTGVRMPFMLLGCLMTSFLVGDFVFNSPFYRTMWLQVLFTPAGAVMRWSLAARLNGTSLRRGWDWLPLGTITANLFGSFVSVLLLAVEFRYYGTSTEWSRTIITAARVGFAGSLSTVSTFVMELVRLSKQFPHHAKPYYYCALTIIAAMILSLIVYIPIVRL